MTTNEDTHKINTIVISDIHLGSPVSNRDNVLDVLKLDFQTLIINGDLFDNYSFHRFNKKDWAVLSKIRKLSKTHKVILVYGNHDSNAEFLSGITGMEFVDSYVFHIGQTTFFAEHGDKYDHWIKHRPLITKVFTGLYYWLQRLDNSHKLSRLSKRLSKSWIKAKDTLAKRFISKYGQKYDVLIAGHTHFAEIKKTTECLYVNSGSFCEHVCSYIEIAEDGKLELKFI